MSTLEIFSGEVLLSTTAYQPNLSVCEKRTAYTRPFTAWLLFTLNSIWQNKPCIWSKGNIWVAQCYFLRGCGVMCFVLVTFYIPCAALFTLDETKSSVLIWEKKRIITRGLPSSSHRQWSCSVWPVWPVALLGFSVRLIRSEEGERSHVDPRLHTEDSVSQAL